MAKSSKEEIAKDEQKILDYLFANAHSNIDTIAKKCGFSRQKVWRLIKTLEETKTIWGYSTISDDVRSDKIHFIMLINRTSKPIDEKVIAGFLQKPMPKIATEKITLETIEYTHGAYDGYITFYAESLRSAKKYSEMMMEQFPGYFKEIKLLEAIIVFKRCGIENPHIKEDIRQL